MITPSFNLTATERVLPSLALDFTTAALDSRVTFTRSGGTATYIDSNGYVASAGVDVPRFDYDPATLVCKGLLIEESRTNICLDSQDLTLWNQRGVATATASAITAPDNTGVMYLLSGLGVAGVDDVFRSCGTIGSSARYEPSFWAMQATATTGTIAVRGRTTSNGYGRWDIDVAMLSAIAPERITRNHPAVTVVNEFIGSTSLSYVAFSSDTNSDIYAWGVQAEVGAFSTSYIPTTTAQVTRTDDVATMTGTNFSDWFNASEGAFLFECKAPVTGSSVFIGTVGDGTTTDRIRYMYNTGSMMISVVGGVSQASIDGGTITANVLNKLCAAYEENNYGVSANGNSTVTDLSGAIPTMNQCVWGSSGTQSFLNGHLSKILYYPQRIIDSEVQAFSKG